MQNDQPIQGIKRIRIGMEIFSMRFTWAECEILEKKYGAAGPRLGDLNILADVAAIGMQSFHAGMTGEKLREMNPPIFVLQASVNQALAFAYYGDKSPDDVVEGRTDPDDKKKERWSRKFINWLSKKGCVPNNSGD
jgi:hypothetical protein